MTATTADHVQGFAPSADEARNGRYSPEHLVRVLDAMNQDGVVLLKGVIPVDIIDKLNKEMCADADRRIADPSQEYNHGIKSNILQRPPITESEYLSKDIYFNPFVLQLANAYLGRRPVWNWLTSNTALAGTGGVRQPAHKDNAFPHPLFPYYFIANVPLCDFSAANGATEFWLGSHAATTTHDQPRIATDADRAPYPSSRIGDPLPVISEEALARRRAVRPPLQPSCARGDVLIRDLRSWHAGMPNPTDAHRIMLALGYQNPIFPAYHLSLHLPASQREFFLGNSNDDVEVRAQWYTVDELAKTTADTVFNTRPNYAD